MTMFRISFGIAEIWHLTECEHVRSQSLVGGETCSDKVFRFVADSRDFAVGATATTTAIVAIIIVIVVAADTTITKIIRIMRPCIVGKLHLISI